MFSTILNNMRWSKIPVKNMCILTIAVVINYLQCGVCACVCGWQPTNNGKLKTHLAVEHCFNRQAVSSSGSGTFSYTNKYHFHIWGRGRSSRLPVLWVNMHFSSGFFTDISWYQKAAEIWQFCISVHYLLVNVLKCSRFTSSIKWRIYA